MPDIEIDKLQIEVSASSEDATKKIRSLASAFRSLKKSLSENGAVSTMANALESLSFSTGDSKNIAEMANAIKKIGSQETKLGNVADYLLGISKMDFSNLTSASNVIGELAEIANSVKSVKRVVQSQNRTRNKVDTTRNTNVVQDAGVEEAEQKVGEAEERVKNLLDLKNKIASKVKLLIDSSSVGKAIGQTKILQKAILSIKTNLDAIKRVAFYRAIRSVIKAVTDAIKVGLENVYEYSKAVGGELAPALDRIASASLQMKNQLGAAFGQILVALEPILVRIINLVTSLAEKISWLVSVITGSDTYLVANEIATTWDNANKSAKAYQKTLIGIDEINRLNAQKDSEDDYKDMFREVPTNFNGLDVKIPELGNLLNGIGKKLDELAKRPNPFASWGGWIDGLFDKIKKIPPLLDDGGASAAKFAEELNNISIENIRVLDPVPLLKNLVDKISNFAFPTITIPVLLQNPLPKLDAIFSAIQKYAHLFIQIAFKIANPIPSISALYNTIMGYTPIVLEIEIKLPDFQSFLDSLSKIPETVWDVAKAISAASVVIGLSSGLGLVGVAAETAISAIAISASYIGMQTAIEGAVLGSTLALSGLTAQTQLCFPLMQQQLLLTGGAVEVFGFALDDGTAKLEKFINTFNQLKSITFDLPTLLSLESASKSGSFGGRGGGFLPRAYATGGFPEDGLFYANHGELVGQFSNGRTAVANNEQIVEGISEGVAYANSGVIGAINQLIAVVQQIDTTVELDGLTVSRQLHRYNRQVSKEAGSSLVMEAMA